ncbi:Crp/Fnr family transcriptional regulator [Kibdelosporangium phytohabitans]|uniref:HTH crp-type domain-containing protein n=1 Tax=Kibdelosporangium phytohabitans TaxID=860235 RepID=A0A0N7F4T4_9PSEU|nr:Crp/Fnr family transcriptional regulator [Kibdelosporangium phytohabitans]ALG12319.1 hypothetical protein AOZ06_40545 [Kibdelosporangium phytohabitans]MBE1463877.1 CRP-like cAMP-binding protein [Kibdelosporangium phytohabitans]
MGQGLIEEVVKWRRRGLSEPWLEDSFMAELPLSALQRLERCAWLLNSSDHDVTGQRLAGEDLAPVLVVLTGAVKIFHARWDGPDVLVNVAGPGDVLNAEEVLTGSRTITRLEWNEHAHLMGVSHRKFREILDRDEDIRHALVRTMARRVQELTAQRGHIGRRVDQRLWAFLVQLARRHGMARADGVVLQVGLTRPDLAAAIGASANSVDTAIVRLRKAGMVTTGYASMVLHEVPNEDELDRTFWHWSA